MNNLKLALDHLESRLQSLVESSAARLFPNDLSPHELSSRLLEAVRSNVQLDSGQGSLVPNHFIILVHPLHAEVLQNDQLLVDGLKQSISEAIQEMGLDVPSPMMLRFEPDSGLAQGEITVLARNIQEEISQTNDVAIPLDEMTDAIPEGAFLIVNGTRIFPLDQAVVNIGRRSDNHLVVDDPRVSRLHAQLRLVRWTFHVVLDLDSTGGTWVNGKRVNQHTLFPGDVISLSGVPIVFGQDDISLSETQEYVPPV